MVPAYAVIDLDLGILLVCGQHRVVQRELLLRLKRLLRGDHRVIRRMLLEMLPDVAVVSWQSAEP